MRSFLAFVLFISLAACGGGSKQPATTPVPTGTEATPTEADPDKKLDGNPADEASPDGDKQKADPCEGGE